MKYLTGEEVKVGDKVRMWQRCLGVVVYSIDTDEDLELIERASIS